MNKVTLIAIISAGLFSTLTINNASASKHVPTQAQIDAAKKVETEKRKIAEGANKKLNLAKQNLKELTRLFDLANQKYLNALVNLRKAEANTVTANNAYNLAVAAVGKTHDDIGRLAISAYMTGGRLSDIESILDARGPQELIDRVTTLENLGNRNDVALSRFKAAEAIAQKMRLAAIAAKRVQELAVAKVAETKKITEDAKRAQANEVAKLQAVQDKLARDLASARNVRITLEQKRQLALLEENRSQTADRTKVTTKVWRNGGPTGKSTIRTSESQRLRAVEFAKRQVLAKKPYVWGAEGPNSFDCSGLVYAAYRYAGLGWPIWDRLNAALYYTYTKQIPIAEMQPGDLIFYSYNGSIAAIHHMSIYAGDGMMWEARSTKTGLRYSSINSVNGMMPFVGRV